MGDLGDACLKAGRIDRAVAVYREMAAMEPDDAVAFANLATALVAVGDMAGADAACTRAAAIEPEKGALYYSRLATACQQAGHFREAENAARKSIAADPAEPAHHLSLGDILITAGRIGEGWQAYEEACSLRETAAAAYYHRLGNALAQAARPGEAVRAFGKAVTRDPSNPIYRLRLAESCLASGQIDLARALLDPFSPP
jgi:tetratricopeptide (TPR) repeat protein